MNPRVRGLQPSSANRQDGNKFQPTSVCCCARVVQRVRLATPPSPVPRNNDNNHDDDDNNCNNTDNTKQQAQRATALWRVIRAGTPNRREEQKCKHSTSTATSTLARTRDYIQCGGKSPYTQTHSHSHATYWHHHV